MLSQLHVRQFAIVKELHIDFRPGMTAITGETGAGKSIALDALGLCLGARADAGMVRPGAEKSDISAVFDLRDNTTAQDWLRQQDLDLDDSHECILRRTLSSEGRSKAYINGAPATVTQLKELGQRLVNIHGQHEHQLLSQPEHQLHLLDQYAKHKPLLDNVRQYWQHWQTLTRKARQSRDQQSQLHARQQLIHYQVEELRDFNLKDGEFEQVEQDHQRMANASTLRDEAAFGINCLYDGEHNNAYSLVQTVIERLRAQTSVDPALQPTVDILTQASVHIEEAVHELRHYQDDIDVDGDNLQQLEQRLTTAMHLAKKHQINAEQLPRLQHELEQELASIQQQYADCEGLDEAIEEARQHYQQAAQKLSKSRSQAARQLSKSVIHSMQALNMSAARFDVQTNSDMQHAGATGIDHLQFMVSANPGQPLQPLHKVASGGELSRISLAIQVITANQSNTPTLMFDEVDVGVSGPTAATVGSLLRRLGETNQVICVTHLPQVAAKAHQQMRVEKLHLKDSTETRMTVVSGDERVIELARLLGGDIISDKTMANAQELLAS